MASLFDKKGRWPQENEAAEKELRQALTAIADTHAPEARAEIAALEETHRERREWVWCTLEDAPLAGAIEHLATLARHTAQPMVGRTVSALSEEYAAGAWRTDDAALRAMAAVDRQADVAAVRTAVRAVYRPWLERASEEFQAATDGPDFAARYALQPLPEWGPGTCVVFCDGLRLDLAHRLEELLAARGLDSAVATRLTALPSITTTAKQAVSPVADLLGGSSGLDPAPKAGGGVVNVEVLRRMLAEADWQVLRGDDLGDPSGRAWSEADNIDNIGHNETKKLPRAIGGVLSAVAERVEALTGAGWTQVVVLTDHGWLYLPGALPKATLPIDLAKQNLRKGRCARLKEGAFTDLQVVPWHWDSDVSVAMAPGICCFQQGKEYEHGGLSPQECVTPIMTITNADAEPAAAASLSVRWIGLRCAFVVENAPAGASVDVRTKAGDASSSLLAEVRPLKLDGTASVLIEDDAREGEAAFAILLTASGMPLAQGNTTVGGEQ